MYHEMLLSSILIFNNECLTL